MAERCGRRISRWLRGMRKTWASSFVAISWLRVSNGASMAVPCLGFQRAATGDFRGERVALLVPRSRSDRKEMAALATSST
jgi:hypothetical protein